MDLETFCLYWIFYAQLSGLPVEGAHTFGNSIALFCLKGFQILMNTEAPGELDKLQIPGPRPPETLIQHN